jgi:hypothetical protein
MVLGLHLGHQSVRGNPSAVSYTDWKIGLSKTFDDRLASPWAWPMSVPTSRTASRPPRHRTVPRTSARTACLLHQQNFLSEVRMKLITAIIKPFKLDEVREALSAIGCKASP